MISTLRTGSSTCSPKWIAEPPRSRSRAHASSTTKAVTSKRTILMSSNCAGRSPRPRTLPIRSMCSSTTISISTGNFVFRRALLERIGGLCAMRVCHDWDFLLAASYETPLAFIDEPLYLYRLHGTNTFAGSRVLAAFELEQVLTRFFARLPEHPLLRDPDQAAQFQEFLRRI